MVQVITGTQPVIDAALRSVIAPAPDGVSTLVRVAEALERSRGRG